MGLADRHDANVIRLIEALALEADEAEPPPELRARLLETAGGERQERHHVNNGRPALGLAGAALLASLGVAAWALSLDRSLDHTRLQQRATVDAVVLIAQPDTRRLRLRGADGLLAVDRIGRAVLVVNGLRRAPEGKTYQTWLIRSGPAESAGVFVGGGELSVVVLTRRVPPSALVAVSLEREGGARRPHRPLVFAAARRF